MISCECRDIKIGFNVLYRWLIIRTGKDTCSSYIELSKDMAMRYHLLIGSRGYIIHVTVDLTILSTATRYQPLDLFAPCRRFSRVLDFYYPVSHLKIIQVVVCRKPRTPIPTAIHDCRILVYLGRIWEVAMGRRWERESSIIGSKERRAMMATSPPPMRPSFLVGPS